MASASGIRMGKVFVEIGADASKFFRQVQGLNRQIGRIGQSMQNVGSRMAGVGAALAAPIALAVRQFATFDDAIRATAAVTGASGDQLQSLNDRARELGATTSFTAVQVANLMTELGRAGFKPDEINAMTGAVLNLARATGTDATLASGIMAATLRQFSLQAGDAARVADVLTTAANATFNTVEGLGESLKYAGPVAASLGMSLEDTVAVLGVLGNVGIQGSEAGTALRRLSVIAAGSGEELQQLFGISNMDATGQLKPLVAILDEINTVTANMPVAERTAKMAKAFGLLGITSANVLSQSAGGVAELAGKLRTADGAAAKTASMMDAGLGGSMRILLSAVEGVALAVGDALAPAIKAAADNFTQISSGVTRFIKANQQLIVTIASGIVKFFAIGAGVYVAGTALGFLSGAIAVVLTAMSGMIATIVAVGVGFVGLIAKVLAFKIASVAAATTSAVAWAALHAPFIAIGLAAAALGVALFRAFDGMGLIVSAVGGVTEGLSSIGRAFGTVRDIGVTAFSDIVASIKAGDLEGAFKTAMQAAMVAFQVGSTAIINALDEWATNILNTLTFYIGSFKTILQAIPIVDVNVRALGIDPRDPNVIADERLAAMRERRDQRNAASANAVTNFNDTMGQRRAQREAAQAAAAVADVPAAPRRAVPENDPLIGSGGRQFDAQRAPVPGIDPIPAHGGPVDPQLQADREAARSQSEVAGTFSAMALSGMGFGSNLQQRQLEALNRIADNTSDMETGLVAE